MAKLSPHGSGLELAKLSSGPKCEHGLCVQKLETILLLDVYSPRLLPYRGILPRLANSSRSTVPKKHKHTEVLGHYIVGSILSEGVPLT